MGANECTCIIFVFLLNRDATVILSVAWRSFGSMYISIRAGQGQGLSSSCLRLLQPVGVSPTSSPVSKPSKSSKSKQADVAVEYILSLYVAS